ncbi:hypothetical protein [Acidovorax sp. PRC11]|nr:hypothetical protein [Acidovorax sp. PRC11]MDT0138469.1 hypothetical protein [Acidovorax sp. PRC11]
MPFVPSPSVLAPGARQLLAVTARAWGLRPAVRGPRATRALRFAISY